LIASSGTSPETHRCFDRVLALTASSNASRGMIASNMLRDRMRSRPFLILLSAFLLVSAMCATWFFLDPLPPRRLVIATGAPGSPYDNYAQQYQRILARNDVTLEIRHSAGALANLQLLHDESSKVQAALATYSFENDDPGILYSLGGTFDSPIYIFYRSADPITVFSQFRGKRLAIGAPGTALRLVISQAMKIAGARDPSNVFLDLNNEQAVDGLIAGQVDIVALSQPETALLRRLLSLSDIHLMNIAQAEAIAKMVPGLKHIVLWRGLIDLGQDLPDSNIDLLAFRNRLLVRRDLHPALQYLLLDAMREVHWPAGPFNTLGEFPAEQPNDLPLSPTAEAFYRNGPNLWQRYTWFWLSSLLDRIAFFGIPVFFGLIPLLGFLFSFHRWLYMRRHR
jgi:TRAP-type uncharacterized transport system substrate-binding protein